MAGEDGLERKRDTVREFFAHHVKTIVTLVMIFGTILCIVLIVLVHKWRFENEIAEEIHACLDFAVIGAGISGSYATWRMRHDTVSKIHLFEQSDRVGGRFYTHRFPEYGQTLKAELGALYYLPQRHQLLNRTIHALKLTPIEYYPQSRGQPTYYLRDQHRTMKDLKGYSIKPMVYDLLFEERDKSPEQLKRYFTDHYLDPSIHDDPLGVTFRDSNLYDVGYWSFINSVASREAFNYMYDAATWRSHVSNGNAALIASLDQDTWDNHYTIDEGMDALPKNMVQEFVNTSRRHRVHYNRRLTCVHKEEGYYQLIFHKTVTRKGRTKVLPTESVKYCARTLILSLPASALKDIQFTGFDEGVPTPGDLVQEYLEPVPSLVMYFLFNRTWWIGQQPGYRDIISDLPARQMRFIGSSSITPALTPDASAQKSGTAKNTWSYRYLFMVVNADMNDVAYFDSLLRTAPDDNVIKPECNTTFQILEDLKVQIAKMQKRPNASVVPTPIEVIIQDWRQDPFGGGWNMWKTGTQWTIASKKLQNPYPNEDIYMTGSDICPGSCQFWGEGALETVESLFRDFSIFEKAYIAPVENQEPDPDLPSTTEQPVPHNIYL